MFYLIVLFNIFSISAYIIGNPHQFVSVDLTLQSSRSKYRVFASISRISADASPRVQRIKDISLTKLILNDLTAAEFALKVEDKKEESKIDYEMIFSNLERSIESVSKRKSAFNDDLPGRLSAIRNEIGLVLDRQRENQTEYATSKPTSPLINVTKFTKLEQVGSSKIKDIKDTLPSLRVFVREDGTVDWEEALASGKEVAKFGTELWERLNGKEEKEGLPSVAELLGQVAVKQLETVSIQQLRDEVNAAKDFLQTTIKQCNEARNIIRRTRKEGLTVSLEDLLNLRKHEAAVAEANKKVTLAQLDLDMERICVYLEQELTATATPAQDQRLLVAEVGLLDKQLSALFGGVSDISTNGRLELGSSESFASLIDEDELALVTSQVEDLKNRLGLEAQGSTVNWGSLGVVALDAANKIKTGLDFFGQGTSILIGDLQYAWALLLKAVTGYILKPREVNAVRRTGKDLLTLIPFTIILIVPLTPIGHVLVFSFIQRYFPDFFPSCFTDKRQNLCRLYSEIERKSDDEMLEISTQVWSVTEFFESFIIKLQLFLKEILNGEILRKVLSVDSE